MTVLGKMAKLLSELKNFQHITLMFPVAGHSFLPSDRVFGHIEKVIRKKDTIVSPFEYKEIFDTFGTVKSIGNDVAVLNWKGAIQSVERATSQLHFKFAPSKRLKKKKGVNG
ncbi:hypothetical protein PR048_008576 [Dryococelus australis]|uniref:Uncharacterized protein n=1 Tax=Dryococelus australis TaxID=614101 RepID=A0ABQ9HXH9_9NEOP|nr:hypothetical protein PR048_008576 [Dryococelus australis]